MMASTPPRRRALGRPFGATALLAVASGCAAPPHTAAIRVVNASAQAIETLECRIVRSGGGEQFALGLDPSRTATFRASTERTESVTLDVFWEGAEAPVTIDLGPVDAQGATVRLLGPGEHTVDRDR